MSWNREKQAAEVVPPIAGQTVAVNCSTTVTVVDLTSLPRSVAVPGEQPVKNPVGSYIRITAQGGDVYFTTGSNFAALNTINTTVGFTAVNATTGAVTFNATTASTELDFIPAGAWKDFVVMPGQGGSSGSSGAVMSGANVKGYGKDSPCRYVALITSTGNATARIHQSST